MTEESVFRFISVRPATVKKRKVSDDTRLRPYDDRERQTDLSRALQKASLAGQERVLSIAREFQKSNRYITSLDSYKPLALLPLLDWLTDNSLTPIKDLDPAKIVKDTYAAGDFGAFVTGGAFRDAFLALADTILIDSLLHNYTGHMADEPVVALKVLHFLELFKAGKGQFNPDFSLGSYIAGMTVIFSNYLKAPEQPAGGGQNNPPPPQPDPNQDKLNQMRERLKTLETARQELTQTTANPQAFFKPKQQTSQQISGRLNNLEQQIRTLSLIRGLQPGTNVEGAAATAPVVGASPEMQGSSLPVLNARTVQGLSADTQQVLQSLNLDAHQVNPVSAVGRIELEMSQISSQLVTDAQNQGIIVIGGITLDAANFSKAMANFGGLSAPAANFKDQCRFMSGIGDLLMVKQKLIAYELGEFAHVENVMMGETRERNHRRLERQTETITTETETETEKERDLQSTERNELQSEATKTVKDQTQLDAGLQVSGSYGPSISFAAHVNASFSSSTEESQRKSSRYSREVTEKTAERVRELVRQQRTVTILQETEETNLHRMDNSNPLHGHIRGVYRWLNKIYDAQVYNYGQRMMYEFIMPEPAAYFLYAMVENPPNQQTLVKPLPPTYNGSPLKPDNLTRTNYQGFLGQYGVTSVNEPPSSFQSVSYFDKQEGQDTNGYARSGKVTIPNDYEAYGATVETDYIFQDGKSPAYNVMIGGQSYDQTGFWGASFQQFSAMRGEISIAYIVNNVTGFTLGVDIACRLTDEGLTKWRQSVYQAIMEGYQKQKSEYESKLDQMQIQQGVQILGQNPLENRRVERDELKKLAIMMLTGSPYLWLNDYYAGNEPLLNIGQACRDGSFIRFFENAFEWNNIMYVCYPYFWGRHARWSTAIHLTDPDPDFAAFLKAGAVRVQVPVRPGFERALAHFAQTGEIWDGNDIPLRDDDLYVPIVNEITENLGKIEDGVPYPAGSMPWEVTVPTELVLVQNLEEIPNIRDILTGQNIKIVPTP